MGLFIFPLVLVYHCADVPEFSKSNTHPLLRNHAYIKYPSTGLESSVTILIQYRVSVRARLVVFIQAHAGGLGSIGFLRHT